MLAGAALLDTDGIDWSRAGDVELDPQAIDSLVYMRDVEGFTNRDLVGLSAHPSTLADPLVRRFLDVWRAEEAEHARAIDRFLTAYCAVRDVDLPAIQEPPPSRATGQERALLLLTRPVGHVVTAAHMTWGAANELLTLNGYRLLARRCSNPVLTELLARIAAQEARHYGFYFLQAQWRLAESRLARATLRRVLRDSWTPVGIGDGYKSPDEFAEVLGYLAVGDDGDRAVRRMDRTFGALPGLADLDIYARAIAG